MSRSKAIALVALALACRRSDDERCGDGFAASGARCLPAPGHTLAPDVRVRIPASRFAIGPADWEAEGRVAPRTIETRAFDIDAFELHDASGRALVMTRDEAVAMCAARGGRLPTEDEWMAAAGPSRYPWGDTGAVCRRAAWGLAKGPCSDRGDGPDTVGAHPSGDTPLGVHDMAGNVAEWVVDPAHPSLGVAHGGSWASALATELRVWSRIEVALGEKKTTVGARCAYDAP